MFTARFDDALAFASNLHRAQCRKGTLIPYISHLLAVTALVMEDGGSEDEAIAALLHDAIEDQGDKYDGARAGLRAHPAPESYIDYLRLKLRQAAAALPATVQKTTFSAAIQTVK